MLIKDIVFYQNMFAKWETGGDSLREGFELLQEIGNLYVVPANTLKDRLRDGLLGRAKRELLIPYLQRREDYMTSGIDLIISGGI